MSVQFVLGRAGSGKSEYIYKRILAEAEKNLTKNFYLFVPEQYTLSAQLKLLELSEKKALFNVEALSFSRFARRVFNELGTGTLDVLEDTGKSLLISKILKENNDSLTTLKNSLMNQGGVEELKSLFSEFYQYGVKSEDLKKVFEGETIDPFFKKKGEDIITLFDAFQEEIKDRFFTAEEIPALLVKVIDSSLLVRNSCFFFDGYTGFTPVQYDVLEKMMKLSEKIVFSFTMGDFYENNIKSPDNDNTNKKISETDLFYLSETSKSQLEKLCEFTGTKILPDIMMPSPEGRRFKSGSRLFFLEENIFAKDAGIFEEYANKNSFLVDKEPEKSNVAGSGSVAGEATENRIREDIQNKKNFSEASKKSKENTELLISLLQNPRDEISFVCSEISKLVRTGKYHYRDFAVLCAGTSDYENDAPHIFEQYEIPYFMDSNVSIFFNPLLEFIESALRIARYNFRPEDVINFMRTGLADFEDDEIDLLDDYLFSSGYSGKSAFEKNFELLPEGFSEEDLVKVNEIRERLCSEEKIIKFTDTISKKNLTYKEAAAAAFDLFTSYEVERKLFEIHLNFSEENDELHSKEYEEIFGKVIEVLDRMVRLLGESFCTKEEFSDDLMMLLSSINVGVLPYSNDCVIIGDMERSRLSEIKILFLVGCHDGNIPGSFDNGGLLSDSEREKLFSLDFHLAPTNREKAFIKKFYLYLALSRGSEKLYISFTKKDKAGNSVLPSYLILDILKLFPDIKINHVQKNALDRIYSKRTLTPFLASFLRDYSLGLLQDKEKIILFSLYYISRENENSGENFTLENAAFYDGTKTPISKELIKEIHKDEKTGDIILLGSVSNLETYYKCPYEYFLKYGLSLRERQEYGIRSLDLGNIYHHVMQNFSNTLLENDLNFADISDEKIEEILSFCIDEELKAASKSIAFSSAFEKNIIKNIKATLRKTIKEFSIQLKRGHYFPRAFEYPLNKVPVAPEFNSLTAGGRLRLLGSIDRIDTSISQNTNEIYLRIIDYKTGHRTLDEGDLNSGLELQLFTYLDYALRAEKLKEDRLSKKENREPRIVLPGGVYFSQIKNPVLTENMSIAATDTDYSKKLLESYKLEGLTYSSENNLHATDNDIFNDAENKTSPVTGFYVKKDGTVSESGKVVSVETMNSYIDLVKNNEITAANNILNGDIRKYPYIKKSSANTKTDNTACTFCPYKDVCLFDPTLKGNYYRKLS